MFGCFSNTSSSFKAEKLTLWINKQTGFIKIKNMIESLMKEQIKINIELYKNNIINTTDNVIIVSSIHINKYRETN